MEPRPAGIRVDGILPSEQDAVDDGRAVTSVVEMQCDGLGVLLLSRIGVRSRGIGLEVERILDREMLGAKVRGAHAEGEASLRSIGTTSGIPRVGARVEGQDGAVAAFSAQGDVRLVDGHFLVVAAVANEDDERRGRGIRRGGEGGRERAVRRVTRDELSVAPGEASVDYGTVVRQRLQSDWRRRCGAASGQDRQRNDQSCNETLRLGKRPKDEHVQGVWRWRTRHDREGS